MQSGTQLAHYEIPSAIGKGGMGEVWRTRDTKLGRVVAIKIPMDRRRWRRAEWLSSHCTRGLPLFGQKVHAPHH